MQIFRLLSYFFLKRPFTLFIAPFGRGGATGGEYGPQPLQRWWLHLACPTVFFAGHGFVANGIYDAPQLQQFHVVIVVEASTVGEDGRSYVKCGR